MTAHDDGNITSVPAVFCNRFYISMGESHVRFTFAEQGQAGGVEQMRNAVALSKDDARALRDLMNEWVKDD